jgi:hypothetical protein
MNNSCRKSDLSLLILFSQKQSSVGELILSSRLETKEIENEVISRNKE